MRQHFLDAVIQHPIGFFATKEEADIDPFPMMGPVLLSYPFWGDAKEMPRTSPYIFGDSGGYSVATTGASVDPERVIRWQIDNCTVGVILDIPPYRGHGGVTFVGSAADHWDNSLGRTLLNVRRALPYYRDHLRERGDREGFGWWGVVQGETRSQMDEWFDRVAEIYPFNGPGEGWGVKPHPSNNPVAVARLVRFCLDRKIRRVHFLQTTGPRAVALALGLSFLAGEFDLVTYDSAWASRTAIARKALALDPELTMATPKVIKEVTRAGQTITRDFMRQCPCESCRLFVQHLPDVGKEYSHWILTHNHIVLKTTYDRIWERAQSDPEGLIKMAAAEDYGRVMRAFGGIEEVERPKGRLVSIFDRV
jgi:hypothetical protein